MVQWLRLCLLMQRVWLPFLVEKLGSHMPYVQKNKTKNRSDIVAKLINTEKKIVIGTGAKTFLDSNRKERT